jgi:hypothetical protein
MQTDVDTCIENAKLRCMKIHWIHNKRRTPCGQTTYSPQSVTNLTSVGVELFGDIPYEYRCKKCQCTYVKYCRHHPKDVCGKFIRGAFYIYYIYDFKFASVYSEIIFQTLYFDKGRIKEYPKHMKLGLILKAYTSDEIIKLTGTSITIDQVNYMRQFAKLIINT